MGSSDKSPLLPKCSHGLCLCKHYMTISLFSHPSRSLDFQPTCYSHLSLLPVTPTCHSHLPLPHATPTCYFHLALPLATPTCHSHLLRHSHTCSSVYELVWYAIPYFLPATINFLSPHNYLAPVQLLQHQEVGDSTSDYMSVNSHTVI